MSVTSAILDSIHAAGFTVTTRRVQTADGVRYRVTAKDEAGEDVAVVQLGFDLEE